MTGSPPAPSCTEPGRIRRRSRFERNETGDLQHETLELTNSERHTDGNCSHWYAFLRRSRSRADSRAGAAVGLPQERRNLRFMMERITSRKNPLLMKIRKLSSGSAQGPPGGGEYLGDGVKLLEEALRWKAPLTTVVVTEGEALPELPQGVRAIQVPRDVMETISPMNTPQGALFLARLPGDRSAGAAGGPPVSGAGRCAGPRKCGDHLAHRRRPRSGRPSAGERLRRPLWAQDGAGLHGGLLPAPGVGDRAGGVVRPAGAVRPVAVRHRSAGRYRLPGAGQSGPVRGDHRQRGPGVSQGLLECSGQTIRIPMRSRCESLNAAAAASIVLWEMVRQGGLEE